MPTYLAIDVGTDRLAAGVVDETGEVVVRDRVATPPRDVWPALHRLVRRVVAARPDDADPLEVCGVSCEGPIDRDRGTVSPLHLPVWQGFELRERVARPHRAADRARPRRPGACARRALDRRGGQDIDDVMVLLMSDAVEAGVICNGRLLHGRLGNAGQLGHVVVEPDGLPCVCGGLGCLTAYASASAIEEETNRPLRRAPASVIERTGMMIGRAVASAVAVFDLRLVVVTGAVPARVRPARCSTPPAASSTSAAGCPTCGPAPTVPSTGSRLDFAALGAEAPARRRRRARPMATGERQPEAAVANYAPGR